MSVNVESLLKNNMDDYMNDVYTSIPAMVVGIQQIADGLIDVQPLVNSLFADSTKIEFPVLYSVPVIMPCTNSSSITMPINHGDTVLLMFSQRDIDVFKNGGETPHDPSSFRMFNMNDAVALIGLTPINRSKLSAKNHKMPFDNNNLVISHNVGTERESYISMKQDGGIDIEAIGDLSVKASNINMTCEILSIKASTLDIKATVLIDGMNLNNFMKVHTHDYTDDGNPMTTAIPKGY